MSEDTTKITRLQRKLVHTGMEVNDFAHDRPEYLHAIMYQLGLRCRRGPQSSALWR